MKREQVKVGMVVWDRRRKQYNRVRSVMDDMVLLEFSDLPKSRPLAFAKALRPLTARERGESR